MPRARTWSPASAPPSRSTALKATRCRRWPPARGPARPAGEPLQGGPGLRIHHRARQLYCLQTRNGKMNAIAMVRTSVEMVSEGLITKEQALLRIKPEQPGADAVPPPGPQGQGHPGGHRACPPPPVPPPASRCSTPTAPRCSGKELGLKVILVREETKPEDIHGFFASEGILTSPRRQDLPRGGGRPRHGQVLRGRRRGHPASTSSRRIAIVGDTSFKEGDVITIDGTTGKVYLGEIPTVEPEFTDGTGHPAGLGRRGGPAQGHGQRRHPGRRPAGAQVRRRRHRPGAHRAHVQ